MRALAIVVILLAPSIAQARWVARPAVAWAWQTDPRPNPAPPRPSRRAMRAELCRLTMPAEAVNPFVAARIRAMRCALR